MRLSPALLFFIVGYSSTAPCGAQLCDGTCFCIPEEGEPCPGDFGKRRTARDYFQTGDYLKFADLTAEKESVKSAGKKSVKSAGKKSSKSAGKKSGKRAGKKSDKYGKKDGPGQFPTLVPEGCQPYPDVQAVIGGKPCREPQQSRDKVCAFKYSDDCSYKLKNIHKTNTLQKAEVITHVGACGVCSSAQDLAVYMNPGVAVGSFLSGLPFGLALLGGQSSQVLSGIFSNIVVPQFESLNFTPDCAHLWGSNSANSAIKGCTEDCVGWLEDCVPPTFGINPFTNASFAGDPSGLACQGALLQATEDDCSLNDCLACDESVSGSIFQLYAGRTRRKSGILTTVDFGSGFMGLKRDCDSIADIAQIPCAY
jgi:hypothetical protein